MLLVLLTTTGITFQASTDVAEASTGWADASRRYRVPVSASSGSVPRYDLPVEVSLDFTAQLTAVGDNGPLATDSIRVIEVSGTGTVLDDAVPFQFDPSSGFDAASNAAGTLVLVMEGTTPKSTTRTYHVYFDTTDGSFTPVTVADQVSVTPGVLDAGQISYRVGTPAGTYYYQADGSAFSSIVDPLGNDWLNYDPNVAGAGGTYRGMPNFPHPEGHFHPGSTTSSTELVLSGPLRVRLRSTSDDGLWQYHWDIFPDHARATVTRAATNYWFLYEGTPGGEIDASDVVIRAQGTQTAIGKAWKADLPDPEWVMFADKNDGRSLFVAHHENDTAIDSYRLMNNVMTVFGFGRDGIKKHLSATTHTFTVGLIGAADHSAGAPLVRSAYFPVTVTVGAAESGGDGTTTTTTTTTTTPTTTTTTTSPTTTTTTTTTPTTTTTTTTVPSANVTVFDKRGVTDGTTYVWDTNYTEPVNDLTPYTHQQANLSISVFEKASNLKVLMQLCAWQKGTDGTYTGPGNDETCSPLRAVWSTGTFNHTLTSPDEWWAKSGRGKFDWSKGADRVGIIVKDGSYSSPPLLMYKNCGSACHPLGQTYVTQHTPIDFRATVTFHG